MVALKLATLALACGGCLLTPDPPTCDGDYGSPQKIFEVSGSHIDDASWLSSDRLELWFSSDRDGPVRLYRSTRAGADVPFSQPIQMTDGTHTEDNPFVTADRLALYYNATGLDSSVVRATRSDPDAAFSAGVPVPELDGAGAVSLTDDQLTVFYDENAGTSISTAHRATTTEPFPEGRPLDLGTDQYASPSITGDGAVLFVNHKSGTNFLDEHIARSDRRADGTYPPPVDMPELPDNSYDSTSPDDATIVFSVAGGSDPDIYISERSCHR